MGGLDWTGTEGHRSEDRGVWSCPRALFSVAIQSLQATMATVPATKL